MEMTLGLISLTGDTFTFLFDEFCILASIIGFTTAGCSRSSGCYSLDKRSLDKG